MRGCAHNVNTDANEEYRAIPTAALALPLPGSASIVAKTPEEGLALRADSADTAQQLLLRPRRGEKDY